MMGVMSRTLVDYDHFLGLAARAAWDERKLDLAADARAWPGLEPGRRARVSTFVAGFLLAEHRVAADLAPFVAAAPSAALAACFRAQARDEERHARAFDRFAAEVLRAEGRTPGERRAALRGRLTPAFTALFEERLAAVARALDGGRLALSEAVAVYHLLLEGVVFGAAQEALMADLRSAGDLPGLEAILGRVLRDERWHVGLGVRVLSEPAARRGEPPDPRRAVEAWGDLLTPQERADAVRRHSRRLAAAGLAIAESAPS